MEIPKCNMAVGDVLDYLRNNRVDNLGDFKSDYLYASKTYINCENIPCHKCCLCVGNMTIGNVAKFIAGTLEGSDE